MEAPAVLVEYGDYECPYCGAAHGIVKEVEERLGDNLCFAFRHFPITTIHPHAEPAAEAAESAAVEGKFWTMHDLLFENQDRLGPADLRLYAASAGLDTA